MSEQKNNYTIHVHFIALCIAATVFMALMSASLDATDHYASVFSNEMIRGKGASVYLTYPLWVIGYWVVGMILVTPIRRSILKLGSIDERINKDWDTTRWLNTLYLMFWPFAGLIAFVYVPLVLMLRSAFREKSDN